MNQCRARPAGGRWAFWGLALTTLLVAGCRRKAAPPPEVVVEKPAPSAEATVDPRIAARQTLSSAANALASAATPDLRLAAYRLLSKAIHDAREVGVDTKSYEGSAYTKTNESVAALDAGDAADSMEKNDIPTVGEKPIFAPPKYEGTFFLGGVYRGSYDGGGIVVESKGKYYVIKDAEKPLVATYLSGYVLPTGTTVTLALGTTGRDADVVKLSDKESLADEQKIHREAVAEYQKSYTDSVAEYQKALVANQTASAKYKVNHDAWALKRAKLVADLDTQILAIPRTGAGPGAAVSGSASTAAKSSTVSSAPIAAPPPTLAPSPKSAPVAAKTSDPLADQH